MQKTMQKKSAKKRPKTKRHGKNNHRTKPYAAATCVDLYINCAFTCMHTSGVQKKSNWDFSAAVLVKPAKLFLHHFSRICWPAQPYRGLQLCQEPPGWKKVQAHRCHVPSHPTGSRFHFQNTSQALPITSPPPRKSGSRGTIFMPPSPIAMETAGGWCF